MPHKTEVQDMKIALKPLFNCDLLEKNLEKNILVGY